MSDNKKKRLSMLDNLASHPPAPSSLMKTSRPLRAARDAVDAHRVWDLNPDQIIDSRVADRLDHSDIADLRHSIEATGQAVPILVRRHATDPDKYHLVYGRRRLEAIRSSDSVRSDRVGHGLHGAPFRRRRRRTGCARPQPQAGGVGCLARALPTRRVPRSRTLAAG